MTTIDFEMHHDLDSLSHTFYRLRDMFRLSNPEDVQHDLKTLQHILGDLNLVDHDQHPLSPTRFRPVGISGYEFDVKSSSAETSLKVLRELFLDSNIEPTNKNLRVLRSSLTNAKFENQSGLSF